MRRRIMMTKKDELPSEYARLEYIEATGTQYIDTEYVNSGDYNPYKIEVEFQFSENPNGLITGVIFGTATNTNNINPLIFGANNSTYWFGHYGNTGTSIMWGTIDANKHKATYIFKDGIYIDDDLQTETKTDAGKSSFSNRNIGLFVRIRGTTPSTYAKAKIYSCKFYERNDVLVRDFIPARRISDNKIGLYDCVGNIFYTNAGTGEFLGG